MKDKDMNYAQKMLARIKKDPEKDFGDLMDVFREAIFHVKEKDVFFFDLCDCIYNEINHDKRIYEALLRVLERALEEEVA